MSVYNDQASSSPTFFNSEKCSAGSRSGGFTLIELIIVMAIIAILYLVATPNYDSVINNSRVDTAVMGLATNLALARSEAIKQGATMRMCIGSSGDAASCIVEGDETGLELWSGGWRVVDVEGAKVISRTEGISSAVRVAYSCGKLVIYDQGGGRASSGNGECVFTIGIDGDASTNKTLGIVRSGRVRL